MLIIPARILGGVVIYFRQKGSAIVTRSGRIAKEDFVTIGSASMGSGSSVFVVPKQNKSRWRRSKTVKSLQRLGAIEMNKDDAG